MADEKELLVRIKGLDELTPVLAKALVSMEASAAKLATAVDRISPPLDSAKKNTDELNGSLINLSAGVELVKNAAEVVMKVWEKVNEQLAKAVDEALEAEQAENQLTGALVSQGLYIEANVKSLEKYIQAKERETGVSGESIQKMIAMGIQMGLNVQQAEQMEEASRKLAAATGVDVMTAFSQMQGALNGQTKALAKVIPGVKELTEAQLKQGGAIALVSQGLDAQYKLYEGSFAAGVAKAKNELSNVYEAIGKIIIQNPVVIKAVQGFAEWMVKLVEGIQAADKWVRTNEESILRIGKAIVTAVAVIGTMVTAYKSIAFASAIFDALATSVKLYGVAGTLAANGINLTTLATTGLKAAITFLTGPIGLALAAVGLLTAAFYKWPGLFDQIAGSFKIFVGFFLQGISYIAEKAAKLVSIFDKDLAKSLEGISSGIEAQADKWKLLGVAQTEAGEATNAAANKATVAIEDETKALDKNLVATSRANAAKKELAKTYGDVVMGSNKSVEMLKAEASARDKDLSEFTAWLEAKKRMAISNAEEQQMEVNKVRANAIGENGTASGKSAKDQVELDSERKKQSDLGVLRQQGILNEAQYQDAMLASRQKYAMLELQQQQEHQLALATIMGTSEEGYQMKQALEQERFDLEVAQAEERAQMEMASQDQINAMKEQMQMEHLARKNNDLEAYYNNEAAMLEASGDRWAANGARIQAEQVKYGTVMGTLRAVQQTQEFKGTQQFLTDLSSLRNSNSKKAFEVGKKAALVQATVNTFLAATAAFSAMAAIPIVGPALGAVAAAAAVAAGFVNIQKINSQQFEGGQADEGMDSIPGSLAGKSFVLSQGERVVQPAANKDLTEFLNKEKGGSGAGGKGNTYNVTLNYNGAATPQAARELAEVMVKELRAMSERGTPIISDKGVVKST